MGVGELLDIGRNVDRLDFTQIAKPVSDSIKRPESALCDFNGLGWHLI